MANEKNAPYMAKKIFIGCLSERQKLLEEILATSEGTQVEKGWNKLYPCRNITQAIAY